MAPLSLDEQLVICWFRLLDDWTAFWVIHFLDTQDESLLSFLRSRLVNDNAHEFAQVTPPEC